MLVCHQERKSDLPPRAETLPNFATFKEQYVYLAICIHERNHINYSISIWLICKIKRLSQRKRWQRRDVISSVNS